MTNNTPSGTKKHHETIKPESRQTAQKVFLSSSDRLVQTYVTLSRWFSHKTAAFFTEWCTSPSLFSKFEVTRGDSNCSLKNYGFLQPPIFSSHVRMRTNHLATKCNYYARLLNWKYCCCAASVWTLWFFSQYCI